VVELVVANNLVVLEEPVVEVMDFTQVDQVVVVLQILVAVVEVKVDLVVQV